MPGQQRSWWVVGLLGCMIAGFASACGDDFGSCRESRTCEADSGGEAGDAGETSGLGAAGLGGASGVDSGLRGDAGEAGAAIPGGTSSGGAGRPGEGACADGYTDWFTSSFSFPDGEIIGTADFPSMPWVPTGTLRLDTGRLSGAGTAIASQGAAVPYAGSRLRFRVRFTGSDQHVTAAFNAANDGSAGVRVTVASAGILSLTEAKVAVENTEFSPLEAGVDWFVEATFSGAGAEVSLARDNYGAEALARIESTLSTDALKLTATGTSAVAVLASESGIAPSLDELSLSRCGVPAPEYQPLLVDTFERSDSTTVGKAESPAASTWKTSGAAVRIVDGALETKGGNATIPLKVSTSGLRVRTTIRMVDGANPFLWADVNYNVQAGMHGSAFPGFWVFGGLTGYFNTGIFAEVDNDPKHNVALSADVPYFVQLDRDGDFAVLTVRTQSFTGPILAIEANRGLTGKPDTGSFFTVGDEGGDGTRYDELRLDSYTGQ